MKASIILVAVVLLILPANLTTSVKETSREWSPPPGSISINFLEDVKKRKVINTMLKNAEFTSPTLFDDNYVVAYYGHPRSRLMGIVGRHPKPELAALLKETADSYNRLNPDRGVIPAIYLIYGTCQPEGRINLMSRSMVESYIEFAYDNGILIYLDHQIGRYSIEHAMETLLPFLKYPNVHLAFDPEWRTDRPMRVIGSVAAEELNSMQQMMQDYMIQNNIPGKRQLVFHQFDSRMIRNIKDVRSDYDPVILVHTTSGWGPPNMKLSTHRRNALVENIPYKGFKLWYYYSDKPGIHYDNPIMTPAQVLDLNPEPGLIIYQ